MDESMCTCVSRWVDCACVCVCVWVCVCVVGCVDKWMCACVCVCVQIYVYVDPCMCLYGCVCMHRCLDIWTANLEKKLWSKSWYFLKSCFVVSRAYNTLTLSPPHCRGTIPTPQKSVSWLNWWRFVGLVSFFNGISAFVGYLMQKPSL